MVLAVMTLFLVIVRERKEEPSLPRRDLSMQLNTHHSTTLVEKEGSPSPAPQET